MVSDSSNTGMIMEMSGFTVILNRSQCLVKNIGSFSLLGVLFFMNFAYPGLMDPRKHITRVYNNFKIWSTHIFAIG